MDKSRVGTHGMPRLVDSLNSRSILTRLWRVNTILPPHGINKLKTVVFNANTKRALNRAQTLFAITTVDKLACSLCIMCPQYYIEVCRKDLESNNFFRKTSLTQGELFKLLVEQLKPIGIDPGRDNTAHYYAMIKFHKDPKKFRMISGANNSTTTPANIIFSLGLKLIYQEFAAEMHRVRSKIPGIEWQASSTILLNTKEAVEMVGFHNRARTNNKITKIQTADVTRLYTNLDLNKVKWALRSLFKRLWKPNMFLRICPGYKTATWTKHYNATSPHGGKGREK